MKLSVRMRHVARNVVWMTIGLAAAMSVSTAVNALPAGTPPEGAVTLAPSSGDSGTTIAMSFGGAGGFCPGDGVAGHRYSTYIVPRSTDVASITWTPAGNPNAPAFSSPLRSPTGVLIRAQAPGFGDGLITVPINFTFAASGFSALAPGQYWIGVACTLADTAGVVQTTRYWATPFAVQAAAGAGPNNFTWTVDTTSSTTTTTTTTVAGGSTTTTTVAGGSSTTTVAGGTTTTSVAGGTTTTTVAGGGAATVTPASPAPGRSYTVTFPNCRVGETITFSQPQSTPTTTTTTCAAPVTAVTSSTTSTTVAPAAGFRRPQQVTTGVGTATGSFTAAPTTPGTYTVTMTGSISPQRTVTFTVSAVTSTTVAGAGGSGSGGSIADTGASSIPLVVWGVLLLIFGRIAILLGRRVKVRDAG